MDILDNLVDWLSDVVNVIVAWAMSNLMDSPFRFSLPPEVTQYLGYINWIIPFDIMSNMLLAWLGAVVVYYGFQVVLRWAKAVQ